MTKKRLDEKQAIEDFNLFLFHIDDYLDELIEKAENQGFNLDYSLESLINLAKFVRRNQIINDKNHIADFANCWIYLGEVFRKVAENSYWTVGLDDIKNMNYGLYFITGYDDEMSEFIPILYLNNFTLSGEDKLDNNFFYELVRFEINPVIPDLDEFPTEDSYST
ncbi:hypothetical protein [Pasteurella sp. PK-2025]|uniref:hypothetical protein n=1 Tax=unclassified Pasteurella TaxID=2621516 RepID=UPI003C7465B7